MTEFEIKLINRLEIAEVREEMNTAILQSISESLRILVEAVEQATDEEG